MYYYILIGIFFISLFIDIFLSIKNKKIRVFTLSNWGFFLWIYFLLILVMPTRRGINMNEWGNTTFNIIFSFSWSISPLVTFTIVRLKLSNEFEKSPKKYIDIFTYLESRRRLNKWLLLKYKVDEYKGEIKIDWGDVLKETIIAIIVFSISFTIPQLLILNGIRYFRYKKIVIWEFAFLDKESDYKNYAIGNILGGVAFNIFFYFILISAVKKVPYTLFIWTIWPISLIAFFYWYWHTKEDPLNRFHYEQKIWEDPRDKKKTEPK